MIRGAAGKPPDGRQSLGDVAPVDNQTMHVEMWPLEKIIPYEKNPRKISKRAVAKVKASIAEFGVRQPIVVDEAGVVLVGHTRRLSAIELEMKTFPVHVAAGLTEAQKKAYRIADNRTNEESDWMDDLLQTELAEIKGLGFDLSLTGFEVSQVNSYMRGLDGEAPEPEIDCAEELRAKWGVERGQLWEIGAHRLMCGDCTEAGTVVALMRGEKAVLMNTDPPYGVAYGVESGPDSAKRFTAISGDDPTGPELQAFLERAFSVAIGVLDSKAAWYLWHAQMTQGFFAAAAAAAAAQLLIHRQIIWSKSHFILGHGDYHWQHELCFYGWRKGGRPRWFGGRDQSTVWQIDNPRFAEHHPTEKPTELFTRPIKNHTAEQEVVYEPFAGSGPQFAAAQLTNRRCYGLEIEPKYCAVILERMSKMGLVPKLAKAT